jgi:hypothetical protein
MRCLYHTLVPPLVQPVEPLTRRETLGLVYYDEKGDLQAYADLVYGPLGVGAAGDPSTGERGYNAGLLMEMIQAVPDRKGPLGLCDRSFIPAVGGACIAGSIRCARP